MSILRLAAALLAASLAGCGGGPPGIKKITVTGHVTYKGAPLPNGIIKATGQNGYFSAAVIGEGGKFTLTDVVPGEIEVGVMEAPQGSGDSSGKAPAAPPPPAAGLPEKYREPKTSGLKYTVGPDAKDIHVDIK